LLISKDLHNAAQASDFRNIASLRKCADKKYKITRFNLAMGMDAKPGILSEFPFFGSIDDQRQVLIVNGKKIDVTWHLSESLLICLHYYNDFAFFMKLFF